MVALAHLALSLPRPVAVALLPLHLSLALRLVEPLEPHAQLPYIHCGEVMPELRSHLKSFTQPLAQLVELAELEMLTELAEQAAQQGHMGHLLRGGQVEMPMPQAPVKVQIHFQLQQLQYSMSQALLAERPPDSAAEPEVRVALFQLLQFLLLEP